MTSKFLIIRIFLLLFFGFAFLISILSFKDYLKPKTGIALGIIEDVQAQKRIGRSNNRTMYVLYISFSYKHNGVEYSVQSKKGIGKSYSKDQLLYKFNAYSKQLDGKCIVLYNRKNPSDAVVFFPEYFFSLNRIFFLVFSSLGFSAMLVYCFIRLSFPK